MTGSTSGNKREYSYLLGNRVAITTVPGESGVWKTFYDALGRVTSTTDPRTGLSNEFTYYPGTDLIASERAAGAAANALTTYTYYDANSTYRAMLRSKTDTDHATGNDRIHYYGYDPAGRVVRQWGASEYPVQYVYDTEGRMITMRTYRSLSGTLAAAPSSLPPAGSWDSFVPYNSITATTETTTWNYDFNSGLLLSKVDNAGKAVSYVYWPDGKLQCRKWGRLQGGAAVTTVYDYDAYQRLKSVSYPANGNSAMADYTPTITYDYYPSGRLRYVTDAAGKRTLWHNNLGAEIAESIASVPGASENLLVGYTRSVVYDQANRLAELSSSGLLDAFDTDTPAPTSFYYSDSGLLSQIHKDKWQLNYSYFPGTNFSNSP